MEVDTVFYRGKSLSVVGGELSIDAIGDLNPIPWMLFDNGFKVTTDTMAGNDTIRTHKILIDSDPDNTEFSDSLGCDIIKAIAWVEYAGSNDETHCHHPYNPQWNHYWDDVISGHDTCPETKLPCENRGSTANGTMQILRTQWETKFNGSYVDRPGGFDTCSWDSLAWNWKINIFNGKFIYFKDNFYHINRNPIQARWDSLCTRCNANDSIPLYPNKEDLSMYGYKFGATAMGKVNTENWKSTVAADSTYVQLIRPAKYRRPWR